MQVSEPYLSEDDWSLLEAHYEGLVQDAKLVRQHMTHCEHGSQEELDALDHLLMALGIYDSVVKVEVTQPIGEMAVTEG